MKIQTALCCALVICLIQSTVTFGQQTAQSQNRQTQPAPSLTDTQRKNVLEYIELLRTDVRGQKDEIMGVLMSLDVDQAVKFWPIYSEYDAQLTKLNNLRARNIQDYARDYYQMTAAKADELVQNAFNYRRQHSDILASYYGRMKDSVGAVEAARFILIENQLLAVIDLQIASALPGPMVGQPQAAPTEQRTQAAPTKVTVPAGTRILIPYGRILWIRANNRLDTASQPISRQVDDVVVAPRGTTVYGRLAQAKSAGNVSGGAELTLEMTDVVINGTAYPLLTSIYQVASQG